MAANDFVTEAQLSALVQAIGAANAATPQRRSLRDTGHAPMRILAAVLAAVLGIGLAGPAEAAPRLNQTFSNGEYTSRYHLFTDGIDHDRPVGLMVYFDGSGAYGLNNHNSTYLLDADGDRGLVAAARARNMILLTPIAPGPGCDYDGNTAPDRGTDANCWYDGARGPYHARGKAQWASDLITQVKEQHQVTGHTVVGGFSSGAQAATQFFGPAHAERHGVDLTVAIGYGGAPVATPAYSQEYRQRAAWAWDTGTADNAYRTDRYGSIGGFNWYRDNFARTAATWPAGVRHDRPGEFHRIMEREMARFLTGPPINGGTTPAPTTSPAPTAAPTTTRTPPKHRHEKRHRHHHRR